MYTGPSSTPIDGWISLAGGMAVFAERTRRRHPPEGGGGESRGGTGRRERLEDFIGGVNASAARILIKSNSRLRKLATGSTVK